MEKFKVVKEFIFCAAHRLKEHKGENVTILNQTVLREVMRGV